MSNADLVRQAVAALNEGDIEGAVSVCKEDIEFRPLRAGLTGAFIGHEGMRAWWRDTQETFDKFELGYDTLEELADGRVLATGTFVTRGRGSTAETEGHSAAVFAFRDGKCIAMHDYGDAGEARRALSG